MTIVFESNSVWVNGGVPDAEAVTVHVPSGEPAMAADPLPEVMAVGAQAAPRQSPMVIRFAEAPEDHKTGLANTAAAIRKFLFIVPTPPNIWVMFLKQAMCQINFGLRINVLRHSFPMRLESL
jgi:hypothetical protein